MLLGVPGSGGDALRSNGVDAVEIGLCESYGERSDVLFEVGPPFRAGDGDDIVALSHYPSQRQLGGLAALLLRHLLDFSDELQVLSEVFALESWDEAAKIVRREIIEGFDLAGQESTTEGTVRYEPDP